MKLVQGYSRICPENVGNSSIFSEPESQIGVASLFTLGQESEESWKSSTQTPCVLHPWQQTMPTQALI